MRLRSLLSDDMLKLYRNSLLVLNIDVKNYDNSHRVLTEQQNKIDDLEDKAKSKKGEMLQLNAKEGPKKISDLLKMGDDKASELRERLNKFSAEADTFSSKYRDFQKNKNASMAALYEPVKNICLNLLKDEKNLDAELKKLNKEFNNILVIEKIVEAGKLPKLKIRMAQLLEEKGESHLYEAVIPGSSALTRSQARSLQNIRDTRTITLGEIDHVYQVISARGVTNMPPSIFEKIKPEEEVAINDRYQEILDRFNQINRDISLFARDISKIEEALVPPKSSSSKKMMKTFNRESSGIDLPTLISKQRSSRKEKEVEPEKKEVVTSTIDKQEIIAARDKVKHLIEDFDIPQEIDITSELNEIGLMLQKNKHVDAYQLADQLIARVTERLGVEDTSESTINFLDKCSQYLQLYIYLDEASKDISPPLIIKPLLALISGNELAAAVNIGKAKLATKYSDADDLASAQASYGEILQIELQKMTSQKKTLLEAMNVADLAQGLNMSKTYIDMYRLINDYKIQLLENREIEKKLPNALVHFTKMFEAELMRAARESKNKGAVETVSLWMKVRDASYEKLSTLQDQYNGLYVETHGVAPISRPSSPLTPDVDLSQYQKKIILLTEKIKEMSGFLSSLPAQLYSDKNDKDVPDAKSTIFKKLDITVENLKLAKQDLEILYLKAILDKGNSVYLLKINKDDMLASVLDKIPKTKEDEARIPDSFKIEESLESATKMLGLAKISENLFRERHEEESQKEKELAEDRVKTRDQLQAILYGVFNLDDAANMNIKFLQFLIERQNHTLSNKIDITHFISEFKQNPSLIDDLKKQLNENSSLNATEDLKTINIILDVLKIASNKNGGQFRDSDYETPKMHDLASATGQRFEELFHEIAQSRLTELRGKLESIVIEKKEAKVSAPPRPTIEERKSALVATSHFKPADSRSISSSSQSTTQERKVSPQDIIDVLINLAADQKGNKYECKQQWKVKMKVLPVYKTPKTMRRFIEHLTGLDLKTNKPKGEILSAEEKLGQLAEIFSQKTNELLALAKSKKSSKKEMSVYKSLDKKERYKFYFYIKHVFAVWSTMKNPSANQLYALLQRHSKMLGNVIIPEPDIGKHKTPVSNGLGLEMNKRY